jgi:hypothetical protein
LLIMELGNVKWGKVYYIEHSNNQNKKNSYSA